jgi:hypothetical protein
MHTGICASELLGHPIEMRRVPVISGGRPVRKPDGSVGFIYEPSAEEEAFARWQNGEFEEVERLFARAWRAQLAIFDHAATAKLARHALSISDVPKNLPEAFAIAKAAVQGGGQRLRTLTTAYALLGLPAARFPEVKQRWMALGGPSLEEFAPYTAHCLLVDVFFHVAVEKVLIAPERASNRIDVAYLYYIPFSMLFVSNDKLHGRIAPFFLKENQMFVRGDDLKRDLACLVTHYSARSEEIEREGLFRVAGYPPDQENCLTTKIWRDLGLRTSPAKEEAEAEKSVPKETAEKLIAMIKEMEAAAKRGDQGPFTREELADPQHLAYARRIPLVRGRWRLLPEGVKGMDED